MLNYATIKALILSDFATYYKKDELTQKAIIALYTKNVEGMFKFMKETEGK